MATAEKSMVIANEPAMECEVTSERRGTDLAERFGELTTAGTQPRTPSVGDTPQTSNQLSTSDNPENANQAVLDKSEKSTEPKAIISTSDALMAETHVNMGAEDREQADSSGHVQTEADMDERQPAVSVWKRITTLRGNQRPSDEEKDPTGFSASPGALRSASINFWPLVVLVFVLCPLLAAPAVIFCVKSYGFMRAGRHVDAAWYGLVTRFAAVFALGLEVILWAIIIAVIVGRST